MSQYSYSSLSPGPDNVRLLRLMPDENERADIQCKLFEYSLQDSGKRTHLYEALSYTWGGSDKSRSISINKQNLPVTVNLYTALLRLRDRCFERIMWVDAICIDQRNLEEKGHQVQLMAKIYSKATRVLVWLGETADGSDIALEGIRVAAEKESTDSLNNKTIQQAILALLQRPWFRRIWVLQEVAAARHVLIICGSMGIDGYAFCLGVNRFYEARPELESSIRSITYLIRGAIFRPKYAMSSSGRASLDIRPLGELIDMFHAHEATKRVDKVYALLGMSSGDPSTAGLSPDYKVPWEKLFRDLVKFLLYEEVSMKTWCDKERVVIKSKGCVLGQVSVESDDKHKVDIIFKNMPGHLGCKREGHALWTLQASANPIQKGDLVCLLQGAPKPMIIRLCKDYFTVIMITVSPEDKPTKSGDIEWSKLLQSITVFPRDFLLVWDWENSTRKLQDPREYETLIQTNNQVPEHSKIELEGHLDKVTRIWNIALILEDLEEYEKAEERFREVIGGYKRAFGEEHLYTLTSRDKLAWIYKKQQQWKEAEELFIQVIETRKRVQGIDHIDTLSSMVNLALTYRDQGNLKEAEKLEIMIHILKRTEDGAQVTEQEVVQIIRSFDEEAIALLFKRRGDNVPITERVVKAAAENKGSGKEVMALLLKRRGGDVLITEGVVKAAAGNERSGKEVIALLLERKGDNVLITEGVVKAAAGNERSGKEVIALLLKQKGDDVLITEGVVKAAAGNKRSGKEVIALLLKQRGGDVPITEEVVVWIARSFDKEIMALLLERRGDDVPITEGVIKAAAGNKWGGKAVMVLLLKRRGDDVPITEGVVAWIAGSFNKEMMALLLKRRGDNVPITEGVVEAAAGNWRSGKAVMALLLKRTGGDVPITEGVVIQIARSFNEEVMALLLERRGDNVPITEGVVKAAAGNWRSGTAVIVLLLKRRGGDVPITEGAVVQIARSFNKEVMALLLKQKGDDILITEGVVEAAAGNWRSGKEVMALLLQRRGDDVPITEGVVEAAAGNKSGKEVMALLFEQRGDDVPITEGVVKAAAGNEWGGKAVMALLLEQRGDDVLITEGVAKAAAGNWRSGKTVMALLLERRGDDVMDLINKASRLLREELEELVEAVRTSDLLGLDWSGSELKSTLSS